MVGYNVESGPDGGYTDRIVLPSWSMSCAISVCLAIAGLYAVLNLLIMVDPLQLQISAIV